MSWRIGVRQTWAPTTWRILTALGGCAVLIGRHQPVLRGNWFWLALGLAVGGYLLSYSFLTVETGLNRAFRQVPDTVALPALRRDFIPAVMQNPAFRSLRNQYHWGQVFVWVGWIGAVGALFVHESGTLPGSVILFVVGWLLPCHGHRLLERALRTAMSRLDLFNP